MKDSILHNGSPPERIWEEWMGYVVFYVNDKNTCIQPSTSYGVTMSMAMQEMKKILIGGRCAWIGRKDPSEIEDIPF